MTNMLDLALKYGGFTSLDKVYLAGVLSKLTPEEQLSFITPPPSVINAYFAEIYQKQGPQAATDYYFDLSCTLQLFQEEPSFAEAKPFVRLNLSGQSYGFAYVNDQGKAVVFPEKNRGITVELLFEIAQIFPQYVVAVQGQTIYLQTLDMQQETWKDLPQSDFLLTEVSESPRWWRISGLNQEEVCQAAAAYVGPVYYAWSGRKAMIYISK